MKSKIMKIAVTAALVLSASLTSAAQDIDGISLWDKYTKDQLVRKYGQPVEYEAQESEYEIGGLYERIRFQDCTFYLEGNQVTDFYIKSNMPRALTKTINGGIGIGDDVSVLNPIEDKLYSKKTLKDGVTEYRYYLNPDWDDTFYVCVKDNRIVNIFAEARVF